MYTRFNESNDADLLDNMTCMFACIFEIYTGYDNVLSCADVV